MSFLAPWFLAAGIAAISLPILFHLFRRTPQGRLPFSTLMFLTPSPPRLTSRSRLENWPLLLLRAAVLLLLGLAFGRPLLRQLLEQSETVPAGRRLVVLVDVSASMHRGDLWPRAVRETQKIVDAATPYDEVSVATFADKTQPLVTFDAWRTAPPTERAGLVRAALIGLSPGWSSTRLDDALLTAVETLDAADQDKNAGAAERSRRIVLVSDVQSGSRTAGLQAVEWPKRVDVEIIGLPHAATNAGLHPLEVREESADKEAGATRPRVLVTNAADSESESFTLLWKLQPSLTPTPPELMPQDSDFEVKAYVPAGKTRVVRVPPLPPGDVAELILSGDKEPFDNTLWFVPPSREQVRVLHLSDEKADDPQSLRYFLERACSAIPGGRSVTVETVDPHSAEIRTPTALDLDDVAMIVVTGDRELPPAWNEVVAARLDAGIVVAAVVSTAASNPWRKLLPKELAEADRLRIDEAETSQEYALLSTIDLRHPLFAPFNDPRYSDFSKIRFWRHHRIVLDESASKHVLVPARFDSGDPAIVEVPRGEGRIVLFASGWQPRESQLGVSSKFVPLTSMLVELGWRKPPPALAFETGQIIDLQQLSGVIPSPRRGEGDSRSESDEGPTASGTVAQPSTKPIAASSPSLPAPLPQGERRVSVAGPWTIFTPTKREVSVAADASQFVLADGPGIYEVRSSAGLQRIAANVPADESKTAPLGNEALETLGVRLAKTDAAPIPATIEEKRSLQFLEMEARQQLWRWCLAVALGVVIVETWYAGRVARREVAV
jgi:hypothetical protein